MIRGESAGPRPLASPRSAVPGPSGQRAASIAGQGSQKLISFPACSASKTEFTKDKEGWHSVPPTLYLFEPLAKV